MKTIQQYLELTKHEYFVARRIVKDATFCWHVLEIAPEIKPELALNKALPDEILLYLAKDDCLNIRLSIAGKRRLPVEVFEILSSDQNEAVRMTITRNPKVPTHILRKMLNDPWLEIAQVAKSRLNQG